MNSNDLVKNTLHYCPSCKCLNKNCMRLHNLSIEVNYSLLWDRLYLYDFRDQTPVWCSMSKDQAPGCAARASPRAERKSGWTDGTRSDHEINRLCEPIGQICNQISLVVWIRWKLYLKKKPQLVQKKLHSHINFDLSKSKRTEFVTLA